MEFLRRLLGKHEERSPLAETIGGLPLPKELLELIKSGQWPQRETNAIRGLRVQYTMQNDGGDVALCLEPPPFYTIAELRERGHAYWDDKSSAPAQITFNLAICIGDYGHGSDAPIILDYQLDREQPQVRRLTWHDRGLNNRWITIADTFSEFVEILDLWNARFERE